MKPPSWNGVYAQKNLIEWKHGKRVLVDSNIFENQLSCGQAYSAALTPRANTGTWAEVSDIIFTNNIIHDVCGGFAVSGHEPVESSFPGSGTNPYGKNILIKNNLIYNFGTN